MGRLTINGFVYSLLRLIMVYRTSFWVGVALLVVGTGCASAKQESRIAVLQNPTTKQTVECKVNPWLRDVRGQVDNCIAAYKQAGYVVVADSLPNGM